MAGETFSHLRLVSQLWTQIIPRGEDSIPQFELFEQVSPVYTESTQQVSPVNTESINPESTTRLPV